MSSFLLTDDYIRSIKCGQNFTVFLTHKNQVFVCGANTNGQVGLGSSVHHVTTPTRLTAFDELKRVSSSNLSTSSSTESTSGESNISIEHTYSTQTSGYGEGMVSSVYCGSEFTIFRLKDGRLYGCGSNFSGQLVSFKSMKWTHIPNRA